MSTFPARQEYQTILALHKELQGMLQYSKGIIWQFWLDVIPFLSKPCQQGMQGLEEEWIGKDFYS
jgi:hypothetical protein